jgi:endonuclease/exonuclease/phosphatase family metal-dependent hydrolase
VPIKVLQLNIEEGKLQEEIIAFVKREDFDILHFQEVTGGKQNARGFENFPLLKEQLGYRGIQAVYWRLRDDRSTYMSNATFYKPSLTVVSSHIEYLKPYAELSEEEFEDFPSHPSCALDVVFSLHGRNIHCINTHLVWGPTPVDEPYKVEQGKKLYGYIKNLHEPFILSGDFNVTAGSEIVKKLK